MLTLIEGGEIYAPQSLGQKQILLGGAKIMRIGAAGEIDAPALRRIDPGAEVIDARDCFVCPGLIDPHAHLIGAGGEQGFITRQPEIDWSEFARNGVTTVVGCLGTDAIGRSLQSLLCKARELDEHGLSTFIYTGSFQVPPPTITESVMHDIVLIDKVIGVGEVAIADVRSSQPSANELARIVAAASVGGKISGKAGITHFHVGSSAGKLAILHELLDRFDIEPQYVYPTHVTRTAELLDDAIALARRGAFVDTDTVEENTSTWIRRYHDRGGPPDQLTISSDAHTPGGTMQKLYQTLVKCVREEGFDLQMALAYFTSNTARALRLAHKGKIQVGADADLLCLDRKSLTVKHVVSRGRLLVKDGKLIERTNEDRPKENV